MQPHTPTLLPTMDNHTVPVPELLATIGIPELIPIFVVVATCKKKTNKCKRQGMLVQLFENVLRL